MPVLEFELVCHNYLTYLSELELVIFVLPCLLEYVNLSLLYYLFVTSV